MSRKIGLAALIAVVSLALVTAVGATAKNAGNGNGGQTTSINNGGGTPSCGNSCDQSHNPTDYEKPCAPVPGNGCHTLPDTPCERGHGGTEIGNKHCGSGLTILKEQESDQPSAVPTGVFTHDPLQAPLFFDVFYRITVSNNTSTNYTLTASDPLCDVAAFGTSLSPDGTIGQSLPAGGTFQYTCSIDAIPGAGAGVITPLGVTGGTLTNIVTVTATPAGGGSAVTLTDTVTATIVS
jgi:hypothetical protein